MKPTVDTYPNRDELSRALASLVAAHATDAVAARGRFLLALPGGSALSHLARGFSLAPPDASAWHLFWSDERCVPPSDPQSNFHLAQSELLPLLSLPPSQLHPPDPALPPEEAAPAYERLLRHFFGPVAFPSFDLILLGIGADGHIASLFPGSAPLFEQSRWVAPVRHAPLPPPSRITFTLPVLNHARHLLVATAGAAKADALTRVFADETHPPLPAQRLRPLHGDLRWLIDHAASTGSSP